jgi:hypothetical protein
LKNWPTWNGMSYSKWQNFGKRERVVDCLPCVCTLDYLDALQYMNAYSSHHSIYIFDSNAKRYIPYDPIPTQHELLLFSPCPRAVGVLASYPRSGNSLMRTLYEHTTLRVTGSDMQGGLAKHGEWIKHTFDLHLLSFEDRPLT